MTKEYCTGCEFIIDTDFCMRYKYGIGQIIGCIVYANGTCRDRRLTDRTTSDIIVTDKLKGNRDDKKTTSAC